MVFSHTSYFSTGHSLGECRSGKAFGGDPGLISTFEQVGKWGPQPAMGLPGRVHGKKWFSEDRGCISHPGPWRTIGTRKMSVELARWSQTGREGGREGGKEGEKEKDGSRKKGRKATETSNRPLIPVRT